MVLTRTVMGIYVFFDDLIIAMSQGKEMIDRSIHFPRWFYRL